MLAGLHLVDPGGQRHHVRVVEHDGACSAHMPSRGKTAETNTTTESANCSRETRTRSAASAQACPVARAGGVCAWRMRTDLGAQAARGAGGHLARGRVLAHLGGLRYAHERHALEAASVCGCEGLFSVLAFWGWASSARPCSYCFKMRARTRARVLYWRTAARTLTLTTLATGRQQP